MQVRDIMTTNVECLAPNATVKDAAEMMKKLDVGFLPICDSDRLIGTLTDRDIVLRAIAEGKDCGATAAKSIMSDHVFYCFDDDNVKACADSMKDKEVRRMLVLSRNKRLVGVVSIGDLSREDSKAAGKALKDIAEAA